MNPDSGKSEIVIAQVNLLNNRKMFRVAEHLESSPNEIIFSFTNDAFKYAEFLEEIIIEYPNIFNKTFHKDKRRPNSNTYAISCSANKADKFASILYDNSKIYLQRKYDRFAVLRRNS